MSGRPSASRTDSAFEIPPRYLKFTVQYMAIMDGSEVCDDVHVVARSEYDSLTDAYQKGLLKIPYLLGNAEKSELHTRDGPAYELLVEKDEEGEPFLGETRPKHAVLNIRTVDKLNEYLEKVGPDMISHIMGVTACEEDASPLVYTVGNVRGGPPRYRNRLEPARVDEGISVTTTISCDPVLAYPAGIELMASVAGDLENPPEEYKGEISPAEICFRSNQVKRCQE